MFKKKVTAAANGAPAENKMGTMPINKLLLSMSLPMVASMLVQALYNIVDSLFVARISETQNELTAISLAFAAQNFIIAVATGTGVGINALLSKSLGEKDHEKANKIAANGVFLALCSYIVFLVLGLTCIRGYMGWMTSNEAVIGFGEDYLSVCYIWSFGVFGQIVMERLMISTGKTGLAMVTQGMGAVINIILDPILIFGLCGLPEMGIKGAAIATVIGQAVAGIMGIILNLTVNPEITLKLKNFIPKTRVLCEMLIIAIPSVVMQAIGSLMTFSMNNILLKFSESALNVFGIYFKLQSFIFMPVFGLNNGMIPIIAYNYGAEKKERVYAAMKLAAISAVSYMLLGFTVFQTLPKFLLGFFNASADMISVGVPALRIISISFMLAGFSIVSISTCQALGKSIYSLIVSVIRQLVVLIPAAFLLSLAGNVNLVWWAFPIAEVVGCTACVIFVNKVLRAAFKNNSENKTA